MTCSTFPETPERSIRATSIASLLAMSLVLPAPPSGRADDPAAHARRRPPIVEGVGQCRPTVVNISATRRFLIQRGAGPFDIMLGDRFLLPPPEQVEQQSIGSGFLIDPAGFIVTNAHVLAQAVQQTIIFADGTKL